MPHLFVDISAHGLGHLAQVAPVLNALAERQPGLRLTVRSALPTERLAARITPAFDHLAGATDFGFHMIDALRIDHPANISAYRAAHDAWPRRIEAEAAQLAGVKADFVLTGVAYLPLAAAARLGLPAAAMSSLNWADLFAHYYGAQDWAAPILAEMRAAYAAASFLALEPAMPMDWLPRLVRCGPVATPGRARRDELRACLNVPPAMKTVVVALGGVPTRLPVERWAGRADIVWLVPAEWQIGHRCCRSLALPGWSFTDLIASSDAIVAKPGYGTFVEAACLATPVAYIRRDDWPEQAVLIDWLERHGRAQEVTPAQLAADAVGAALDRLWSSPGQPPPPVIPTGGDAAAAWIAGQLH